MVRPIRVKTAFSIIRNGNVLKLTYDSGLKCVVFNIKNILISVEDDTYVIITYKTNTYVLDYSLSTDPVNTDAIDFSENLLALVNQQASTEQIMDAHGIFLRNTTLQAENAAIGLTSYRTGSNVGYNNAIPTTETTIAAGLPVNGINRITFPSSAAIMAIASTSANDTTAGTGAILLKIFGLDSSHDEISEFITLNGTTKVATSLSYLRIQTIATITSGSNKFNVGDVYIGLNTDTFSSGVPDTDIFHSMGAGTNISRCGTYTVPNNYKYYTLKINLNTNAVAKKPVRIRLYNHLYGSVPRLLSQDIVSGVVIFTTPSVPIKAAKTDIEITAENLGAGTVEFQMMTEYCEEYTG